MIVEESIAAELFKKKKFYQILYVQVLIAIVLGVLLGYFFPESGEMMKPLGDGFISLIKMIIAPVIFITITVGIASMNDMKRVGRVAGKAFAYFITFSTLALIIGLIVSNLVQPGKGLNIDPGTLEASSIKQYVNKAHDSSIINFVFDIIPKTLISPLSGDNILQVLLIAILFGIAISLTLPDSKPVLSFLEALAHPVFKIVSILMKLAPLGAFGAIAFTIGKYGIESIGNLLALMVTFYTTSLIFVIGVLGAVARYNGFSIFKFLRYIKDELLLVLGTSSSEAALPTLMQKLEKAGCAKSVVGLVVPTRYSFNLDGTNIYMTLAALFIAQACNIDLSLQSQIVLLLVAMLSSKGAAGVSGAGFITLAATLAVVPEVPIAGMTLILGIDRFMSECRALTNLVGNAVATVVIARWEKHLDTAQLQKVLGGQ
ncbi:MAG TPA: dicarboxylate/amino acid:cation symporter [Niabella sp.]|nr:dicarboxylate/amino acid:cation symporter [Niabella sp.]HOZ97697.1 dicarboxylate/amino acid:cation symporter [Niabella sp.]HQW14003.1 dicarboxylate/amino acid:cation symporter [Niabella sp.]HQX19454.1 dicarboxylate/amino acid:cation symporter [Niabella sp.]HQX40193.1 dicarboxylate/amino acid:cation symporter [Niabella sp.]